MDIDHNYRPKLRSVRVVPVQAQGVEAVGIQDPFELTDRMLCVQRGVIGFLALLDGRRSIRDIQEELTRSTGALVASDDIIVLVKQLDDLFLLDGDRYREAYRQKVVDYRKSPFRPSSHAGLSYSDDPETLRRDLDAFFSDEGGPGTPDYFSNDTRPVGLIAPHIDIRAGGRCFAHGYHALASGRPSDLYVILGTGHQGVENLFTASYLDFQTPLGTVRTDREALELLSDELGEDPGAEELLHKTEHVIEFQALFLQHVLGPRHDFTILPLLCWSPHEYFSDGDEYRDRREQFLRFCSALKSACAKTGRSVCFIASADLDHIGPMYGDRFSPTEATVKSTLESDSRMLEHLERLDTEAFIRSVAEDNDQRRICGFPPITAMLHCMDAGRGRLLDLDFTYMDDRNSFVSFTSMIFE